MPDTFARLLPDAARTLDLDTLAGDIRTTTDAFLRALAAGHRPLAVARARRLKDLHVAWYEAQHAPPAEAAP